MLTRPWFRPALVGLVALIWLAVSGAGGSVFSKLSEEQSTDVASFLPKSAESTLEGIERAQFTSRDNIPAILLLDDVTSPNEVAALQDFADGLAELPVGSEGQVLGDFLTGPAVVLPSQDGQAVVAIVSIPFDSAFEQVDGTFAAATIVEEIRAAWDASGIDGDMYVTGPLGLFADQFAVFEGIDGILLLAAGSVVLIILLFVYRSPVLPLFVLTTAGVALVAAGLVVYVLAKNGVVTFNGQSQGIMSILVVGATTDYALLLVARYREELRRHASPYDAMFRAWRQSVAPIVASAVTVMLGLLTLLLSDLASNQSLGPVSAIGIGMALIAALTFLPALLLVGGARARWIFWPKRPSFHPEDVGHVDTLAEVERHAGVWGRVSRNVATRPRRTWVISAGALIVAAAFLPTFRADGIGDDEQFTAATESIDGLAIYEEHFAAGETSPIELTVDESRWSEVAAALADVDGISTVYPLTATTAAGGPPVPGEQPLVRDGRVAISAVSQVSSSSQEAKELVRVVRDAVHEVDPSALVGGSAAVNLDVNITTDRDLTVIVPAVLLVIFLVLIVLLRALVAPVIIVAANVLSFAATIGVSAIVFNWVLRHPGSDSAVPLFSFVFLVALGVDYSIFLMSRAKEETVLRGNREGIRRALAVTGGVITSAGIVLAATFAALGVLPVLFLIQMAFIVAVGVLIDTFVVRTLLLPGVFADLGRTTWWPAHRKMRP